MTQCVSSGPVRKDDIAHRGCPNLGACGGFRPRAVSQFEFAKSRHPERSRFSGGAKHLARGCRTLPARSLFPPVKTQGLGMTPSLKFSRESHCSNQDSIVASSTSMIGMSSLTGYTRWQWVHFKVSGLWRYSSGCLQAGQTRISRRSFESMMEHCTPSAGSSRPKPIFSGGVRNVGRNGCVFSPREIPLPLPVALLLGVRSGQALGPPGEEAVANRVPSAAADSVNSTSGAPALPCRAFLCRRFAAVA